MKKALAMKCTQEQWDSIKGKITMPVKCLDNFRTHPYISNFFNGRDEITNFKKYQIAHRDNIHETFNAKLFLDACGIETDVYEITKEQVLMIAEKTQIIKEWFPDAFKKELEVKENNFYSIKWNDGDNDLFYCYENNNGMIYHKDMYFRNGKKLDYNPDNHLSLSRLQKDERRTISEATPQEVESALISETKKRYPIGTNIKCLINGDINKVSEFSQAQYYKDNEIYFAGCKVFDKGQWATVIQPEKMTLEQIEKELGRKIQIV